MSFVTALALFALITLALVGLSITYTYATQGFGFGFSSNRGTPEVSAFATRLKRALQNHTESAGYIVPVLAAGLFTGLEGAGVEMAALLIIVGRAAFPILYLSGISFIRVPAFVLATFSSLYLAYLLLTAGVA